MRGDGVCRICMQVGYKSRMNSLKLYLQIYYNEIEWQVALNVKYKSNVYQQKLF